MVEAELALLPLGAESFEELEVLRLHHLPRPLGGEARAARELVERDVSGDREVVVAGEADGGVRLRQLHAGVRLGAVADEVAEAPQLRRVARGNGLERGLEGVPVGVYVRYDRDLHS